MTSLSASWHIVLQLAKQFDVNPDEITHCKATCCLAYYGDPVKADVHWFRSPKKCSFIKKRVIE